MLVRLHVVIDTEDTGIEEEIKEQLRSYCPDISFSPSREQPSLMHCMSSILLYNWKKSRQKRFGKR